MNILVTGATGFIGRVVARELRRKGHRLLILARSPDAPAVRALATETAADVRAGDVASPAALPEVVRGADAIVHLVGIISEAGRTTFENVHARGTAGLVAAAQAAGVSRFVHMSALGTRAGAVSRYHQTKWAAEESVRGSTLRWTIFRPSLVYGPEDHFVNLFAKMARWSPVLPVMGRDRALLQPVAVEAVARAFAASVDEPRSEHRMFDLCGPERMTFPELLDRILRVLGKWRLKMRVPLAVARAQARVLEILIGTVLGKPPPFNRDQLIMLQEDNVGDPGPADALFGLRHPAFNEGIARYL